VLKAVLEGYLHQLPTRVVEPAWRGVTDPIGRVFALLDLYRKFLTDTDCTFGCPIGSLALELRAPDTTVRNLLARNFRLWIDTVRSCLDDAELPPHIDRKHLATFVLTTMEGAVMLARTERSIATFDAAVEMLRDYFDRLAIAAAVR
jgi:AcrR family transcriptional regulator